MTIAQILNSKGLSPYYWFRIKIYSNLYICISHTHVDLMLLVSIYIAIYALACFVLLSWSPLLNDQVLGHARPPHIRRPPPTSPSLRPDAEISRIQLCRLRRRGCSNKCKTYYWRCLQIYITRSLGERTNKAMIIGVKLESLSVKFNEFCHTYIGHAPLEQRIKCLFDIILFPVPSFVPILQYILSF